jgi:hypothetical protein
MAEKLNQLLAERATDLINRNFSGVEAEWWWERRINGDIEICQELDPEILIQDLAQTTDKPSEEVRRMVEEELGLEDTDPVVLTFEVSGESTEKEVAALLQQRSTSPRGLAAEVYRRIEDKIQPTR